MPSITQDPQTGYWRYSFYEDGRKRNKSLETKSRTEAAELKAVYDRRYKLVRQGDLTVPPNVELWEVLRYGDDAGRRARADCLTTVEELLDWYLENFEGTKEANTLCTERVHSNHLKKLLGRRRLNTLTAGDLQERYINKRGQQPATIRKELGTLRMVWNLAAEQGKVSSRPPMRGLKYPKGKQKPPFQTWEQIEQAIKRGKLDNQRQRELWDCLFLNRKQIGEVLEHVRQNSGRRAYFYPLMVFVAHTGARRSEALRALREDFRFDEGVVVIREKKRDRSKATTRLVPMSVLLVQTMRRWFAEHPGGEHAFCKKDGQPLKGDTVDEAFEKVLEDSPWKVLKGFHVFRHSLCSCLAREGVDQREIDAIVGHQTEEMRQRYRHCFPEQKQSAINKLFGEVKPAMAG